jgi:glycosyltransferase involved in cell wall biosynthesis
MKNSGEERMRIVYISAGSGRMECDACLRDGGLARALIARGHDVLLVPTYTPLLTDEARHIAPPVLFYGGVNVYLRHRFPFLARLPRFLTAWLDHPSLLGWAARLGDMTDAKSLADLTVSVLEGEDGPQAAELKRMLDWLEEQGRPDAIVLPNSLFAGLAAPLRRRFATRILCLLSGEDGFIELFPEPYRTKTLEVLRRRAAEIDGFLAPNRYYSDFMARYLSVPAERIHLIPAGIDCAPYREERPAPPDVFTIGYRSPIWPGNGLHLLIEAFRILKANPETAACRLRCAGHLSAGDKAYFHEVLHRVRAWGLERDFEYAGELEPKQRPPFLWSLSAMCVPCVYPESTGTFVAESLAAGVPVVAPRVGCLPEWIEATGGGLLVEPSNPEALAEGLGRLMRNPQEAQQMGSAGRRVILNDFTQERVAEEMEKMMNGE